MYILLLLVMVARKYETENVSYSANSNIIL